MKMEQTECSETSAYTLQTPGNHPKERIQHSVHGESLKSRMFILFKKMDVGNSNLTILCQEGIILRVTIKFYIHYVLYYNILYYSGVC